MCIRDRFSLLGVYFSLVTLADGHDPATTLLYGFAVVYLLSSTAVLLHNAARRPGAPMDPPEAEKAAEEEETEETPDEPLDILYHHPDLLPFGQAAHRPRLLYRGRRRHGPLQAPAGL